MNNTLHTDESSQYIFERANIWNNPNPLLKSTGMVQTVRNDKVGNQPNYAKIEELGKNYIPLHELPNKTSKYDMQNTRNFMKDANKSLMFK